MPQCLNRGRGISPSVGAFYALPHTLPLCYIAPTLC